MLATDFYTIEVVIFMVVMSFSDVSGHQHFRGMDITWSSEMLVSHCIITRRYNPENRDSNLHRHEKLKYRTFRLLWSKDLLENLTVAQLVEYFSAIYETRILTTTNTRDND
jgi:hypothetical protein